MIAACGNTHALHTGNRDTVLSSVVAVGGLPAAMLRLVFGGSPRLKPTRWYQPFITCWSDVGAPHPASLYANPNMRPCLDTHRTTTVSSIVPTRHDTSTILILTRSQSPKTFVSSFVRCVSYPADSTLRKHRCRKLDNGYNFFNTI